MAKLKVLIVEDEALIALVMQRKLARAGYEIVGPVSNGEAAIDCAQRDRPDVVLMDIRLMGEMDGVETAQRIKAFLSTAIIFTTGYSNASVKERAMALAPAAYLIKPVEVHDIEAALRAAGVAL